METTRPDGDSEESPLIRLPGGGDLVAFGGDLKPERLLEMYRSGIFPWYEEDSPILWWSPHPRAILELDDVHRSRSLRRTLRRKSFRMTLDQAFPEVIRRCAEARADDDSTWITRDMVRAYTEMHRLGHAHSVEAWRGERLVGGIYGLAIGAFFAGESMFYRESDASKVALVYLVEHLRERDFDLFDLQILNDHTERLGACEIPRKEYLRRLARAVDRDVAFGDRLEKE